MERIGLLTTSNAFDSHVTAFKKRGFNAFKLKVGDDLSTYSTLIIDLSYPMEQAYPILEAISLDYKFSECIILGAISKKSDLAKLRASALKMNGYISPEIDFQDLLAMIKQCQNPDLVIKKKFDRVELATCIEGKLTHISESGALITSPISFNRGNILSIQSSLINDLELERELIQKVSVSNAYQSKSFLTEIEFLNLDDKDRLKFRQMTHSWGIK